MLQFVETAEGKVIAKHKGEKDITVQMMATSLLHCFHDVLQSSNHPDDQIASIMTMLFGNSPEAINAEVLEKFIEIAVLVSESPIEHTTPITKEYQLLKQQMESRLYPYFQDQVHGHITH